MATYHLTVGDFTFEVSDPAGPNGVLHRHGSHLIETRRSDPEPVEGDANKVRSTFTCERCGEALQSVEAR